jgi:hypothetical protein
VEHKAVVPRRNQTTKYEKRRLYRSMIEPNALLYQLNMINTPINTLPPMIEEVLLAIRAHKQQFGVSSPFETVPVAEIGLSTPLPSSSTNRHNMPPNTVHPLNYPKGKHWRIF